MQHVIMVADLKDPNDPQGRSYREVNNATQHAIPIGTLVEVKFDEWFGNGACWKIHARLWVVQHSRDCDGTPLYGVSQWSDPAFAKQVHAVFGGLAEDSLTTVEITDRLREGYDSLGWDDA